MREGEGGEEEKRRRGERRAGKEWEKEEADRGCEVGERAVGPMVRVVNEWSGECQ